MSMLSADMRQGWRSVPAAGGGEQVGYVLAHEACWQGEVMSLVFIIVRSIIRSDDWLRAR